MFIYISSSEEVTGTSAKTMDNFFFGYDNFNGNYINAEWKCVSLSELIAISINGIEVDCELEDRWTPTPVSELSIIVDRMEGGSKSQCKLIGEEKNVFSLIAGVKNTLKRCNIYHALQWFDSDLKLIQESGGTNDDVSPSNRSGFMLCKKTG